MLVSIIIPCYNAEGYIAECMQSAIDQSYRPVEIIAVDNNSTDKTFGILKEYKLKYPDLITILNETTQGASLARNKGLSIAKGEWIQFLDADDMLFKTKIEKQIKLVTQIDAWVVVGDYNYKLLDGSSKTFLFFKNNPWIALMKSEFGITSSILWKKSAIISVDGWTIDLKSSQEYDLLFKILKINDAKIIWDGQCKTIVRQARNSISNSKDQEGNYRRALELRLSIFRFLRQSKVEVFTELKDEFKIELFRHVRDYGMYNIWNADKIYRNVLKGKLRLKKGELGTFFPYFYRATGFLISVVAYRVYYTIRKWLNLIN